MPSRDAVEAAHLIDRLERLARAGELAADLNPAQWEALRYIARANRFSRTPAALAEYLGSTRGTVSQSLIALERKGLIARAQSETDRRSLRLSLTPAGEKALRHDPLLDLAARIDTHVGPNAKVLLDQLRATLAGAIADNERRAFGVCWSCRHFRKGAHPGARQPHHCALLDEPLSEADSLDICVEQEAA
jgi:DNA-binding MarR family transcriptional regulator